MLRPVQVRHSKYSLLLLLITHDCVKHRANVVGLNTETIDMTEPT